MKLSFMDSTVEKRISELENMLKKLPKSKQKEIRVKKQKNKNKSQRI